MKSKLVVICLALIATPALSQADDLLNILDGGKSKAKGQVETAEVLEDSLIKINDRAILPNRTPEQNIFFRFLRRGEFEKALYQWPSAFGNRSFARTATGRALHGYILYKNNLKTIGIETLLQTRTPKSIEGSLANLWRATVENDLGAWRLASADWNPAWTDVLGVKAEVAVLTRNARGISDTKRLEGLLRKTESGTYERAWLQWQLSLSYIFKNKDAKAAKLLKNLMTAKNNPVGLDLMEVTVARILYQNGYLDEAIEHYQEVPKKSEYWYEAQEEIAWSYMRKGEANNSLAITRSLVNKSFKTEVGPESFYLHSLAQLKFCDYKGVSKTLDEFKSRFREKASHLLKLKGDARNKDVTSLISKLEKGPVTWRTLGVIAARVPNFTTRDEYLYNLVQRSKTLKGEASVAGTIYSRSLSQGTAFVGFQGNIEELKKSLEKRARVAENAVLSRIQKLSDLEITEIKNSLNQMQIVEAEVIQQLALVERLIKDSSKESRKLTGITGSQADDRLSFPFTGEVWFDELSNYQIDVSKGCQATQKGM